MEALLQIDCSPAGHRRMRTVAVKDLLSIDEHYGTVIRGYTEQM